MTPTMNGFPPEPVLAKAGAGMTGMGGAAKSDPVQVGALLQIIVKVVSPVNLWPVSHYSADFGHYQTAV